MSKLTFGDSFVLVLAAGFQPYQNSEISQAHKKKRTENAAIQWKHVDEDEERQ